MAKYVIIKQYPNDSWHYASKKLFGIFNIGIMGLVENVGSHNAEECEKQLREFLNSDRKNNVVVKKLDIK